MRFKWHPEELPPEIEEHSKAKLEVLRRYLRAYFDKLGVNPARDEFRLDLVDGFAGGGTFRHEGTIISGTPLIMLEECMAAQERLNKNRTKPLRCNFKIHFVDVDPDHTNHLRKVLAEREYRVNGEEIVVHNSRFEDVADKIIADVLRRQPRAGRAIFLLDQSGFSQVELALVARILNRLPRAEVILTFASDALLNHLSERPQLIQAVAPIELSESQVHDLIQMRNGDGGLAVVQRVMRQHIRGKTGATYDTPFFIRPSQSRRALWFLHLSRHPTARDVMVQCHWNSSNTFEHYGPGDFDMLGWDTLKDLNPGTLPMFHFADLDAQEMRAQLLNSMPAELHALAAEDPITVDTMRHMLANKTAARFSDLDEIVLRLAREREIDILNPKGRPRTRTLTQLSSTDLIAIPSTPLLPIFSRRWQSKES